ncbi:hypothetical protein BH23ACT10_BH23ACT10_05690 [soil metagenome]
MAFGAGNRNEDKGHTDRGGRPLALGDLDLPAPRGSRFQDRPLDLAAHDSALLAARSPSGRRTSSSAWTPRYGEPEVNELLRRFHDDHATLRRALVDEGFLDRSGGEYWRAGGRVVA